MTSLQYDLVEFQRFEECGTLREPFQLQRSQEYILTIPLNNRHSNAANSSICSSTNSRKTYSLKAVFRRVSFGMVGSSPQYSEIIGRSQSTKMDAGNIYYEQINQNYGKTDVSQTNLSNRLNNISLSSSFVAQGCNVYSAASANYSYDQQNCDVSR